MYRRPVATEVFRADLEIKRSKFWCFITRAETEQQAREFIARCKSTYPDARHHCSAFIIHQENAQPIEHSNDDGEPSGTAGTPMLDVLRGSGLLDIVAVTVRYFGGVKLGAGGLVHAYSDSVAECLKTVKTVTRSVQELYSIQLDHAKAGRIEAELRGRGIFITAVDYADVVTITLAVNPGQGEELAATVGALTAGAVTVDKAGTAWVE